MCLAVLFFLIDSRHATICLNETRRDDNRVGIIIIITFVFVYCVSRGGVPRSRGDDVLNCFVVIISP